MGYGGVWVITGMGYDRVDCMCRQDRMLLMRLAMVSRKHSSFFSLFIAHLLVALYCIPPSACTISFTPLITAQLCEPESISCQLVCVWPQHPGLA